jgi:hypothetical protein
MVREIKEGVSDDGQSFVRIIEDDENLHEDENFEEGGGDEHPITTILKKLDIKSLPQEQQDLFKELEENIKERGIRKDTDEEKVQTVEALKSIVAQLQDLKKPADNTTPEGRKKLAETLKFEDNDFYAPYFKQVASALDLAIEKLEGIEKARVDDKRTSFQEKAVNFIKENKLSPKVIGKMDEISKAMGSGVYNDLPRLLKLAKSELGIKDVPQNRPRPNENNIVEFRGRKKSDSTVDQKPAKTMEEAWNRAQEQLGGE